MAIRNDAYIGPISIPTSTEIVPVILSGSQLSIIERVFNNSRTTPTSLSSSYNTKEIGNSSLAEINLTNFQVLNGTVTNIAVETKYSIDNYATWSNAGTFRGVWTASSTPYNLKFTVPTQFVRNKPGGIKYDFRLSFFGATTKAKIQPYDNSAYASGTVQLVTFPSSAQYGKSGSLGFIPHGATTNFTNYPYMTGSGLKNRIVTFESRSGANIYYSSQSFCITDHSPQATASCRYFQLLTATSAYATPEHWNTMFYSGGRYTMSIDDTYIADAQIKFNGIDDFTEIVGVISCSAYIGSTWVDSGSAADSTLRIGWKSMYAAPTNWYTCSNPYLTYSFLPQIPATGPQGMTYVNSSSFYNISEYIIFMWVSTASVSLGDTSTALPNTYIVPGATASATGGGDWYLYDRITAPKLYPSGGISGTLPDIEYVVSDLPKLKTVSFWVGTLWENTIENQQDSGRYDYSELIRSGAGDNIRTVLTRNKKETQS